jgi:hypothetical protein
MPAVNKKPMKGSLIVGSKTVIDANRVAHAAAISSPTPMNAPPKRAMT